LEPDSKYTVEFDVKASVESPYSYGLRVRSYNAENGLTEILKHFEPTESEFTHKSLDFTTLEDTERILILLYNYEPNSHTEYHNVVIKDSNSNVVKKMEKLKYVPAAIANRLADISLETENASSRVYFAKDGLKIIKDYPIAGAGGGAWKNLYRQYQPMPYNTTEVHNFYVQYGTEVGIIGLAVLIGLLLLLILSMIKSIKDGSRYLYVYLAAMLLLLHSTIDFNLSLAAVGYMLWLLIGIIGSDRNTPLIQKLPQRYIGASVLILSLIVFIVSSSVYYGMKLGVQGAATSQENKDMDKAMELYERASKFDRYNGAYRIDLAQIMNNKLIATKDKKYYDGIMEQISLIRKYEPYNHQYTPIICSLYLSTGKFEEASKLADTKLQEEPMVAQSYLLKTDVNYELANYYLKENKVQEAIPYLEKIIEAKDQFEKINKSLKAPLKLTEDYTKKLEAAQRTLDMIRADMKK
jgi:tetratricopeptide (TPR) repeat protein